MEERLETLEKEALDLQRKISSKYPMAVPEPWPEELKEWQSRLWELRSQITREKEAEVNKNKEILLDVLEHQAVGGGRVIDADRAASTPCKGFTTDEGKTYAWSPGILGLMSSERNPEQIRQYCALGIVPDGSGVKQRFEKVQTAIEEAHKEWERKGGGLPGWWSEVAKALEKHKVAV
jgi:hypothetical protein